MLLSIHYTAGACERATTNPLIRVSAEQSK